MHIIKTHFGENQLLFCFHDFRKENGMVPHDWLDLFEFMNFRKAKAELQAHASRVAEAERAARSK